MIRGTNYPTNYGAPPLYATNRTHSRPTDGALTAAASRLFAGGPLLPWQQYVADVAGERDPDTGLLVYDTVTLVIGRRAGKTRLTHGVPMSRALMGPLTVRRPTGAEIRIPFLAASTAQNSTQAIKRLRETWDVFRETTGPEIASTCRMLSGVNNAALELNYRRRNKGRWESNPWASRLSVFPPTPHGVRGDRYLFLSIDEALTLTLDDGADIMEAARPTLSEFAGHAQLWIVSNEGKESAGFLNERKRLGRAGVEDGRNTGNAYFEWAMTKDDDPTDPAVWHRVHPALGLTLTEAALQRDLEEFGIDAFAREYLNYTPEREELGPLLAGLWDRLSEPLPATLPPRRSFAFEVSYDRSSAVILAAWVTDAGVSVSVVDSRPGTGWLPAAVTALAGHERTGSVVYDALGPAADIGRLLEHKRVQRVEAVGSGDPRAACGAFIDLVRESRLHHDGDPELAAAATGAITRPVGDLIYWDRRRSPVDIAPIVAATLAVHAAQRPPAEGFIV